MKINIDEIKNDPHVLDKVVLNLLFKNEKFRDTAYPYLKKEIFQRVEAQRIFALIDTFSNTFTTFPTVGDFCLKITNNTDLDYFKSCFEIEIESSFTFQHLLTIVQNHIKKSLIANETVSFMDDIHNDPNINIDEHSNVIEKLNDIFAFSFDNEVGLDVFSDDGFESMWEYITNEEECISTGIPYFDFMIKGGFHNKTLSLFLAGTNKGKSLIMSSLAAQNVLEGKKVLYITFEMSDMRINERIYANLMNININNLTDYTKDELRNKFNEVKSKCEHKLILKEYPPRMMNTNNITRLIKELKDKKKFEADIIYVDYMTLMKPNTSGGKDASDYTNHKIVSENLIALAKTYDIPVVSAIQTNRDNSDRAFIGLDGMAESFAIAQSADIVIAITQTAEQKQLGLYTWSVIKNRYGENNVYTSVKVNYNNMRIESDPDANVMRMGDIDSIDPTPAQDEMFSGGGRYDESNNDAVGFVKNRFNENKERRTAHLSGLDFS